jgi:hypothetical protein
MFSEKLQEQKISMQRICTSHIPYFKFTCYLNYELNKPTYWKLDFDDDDIGDQPDEIVADLNRE